MRSPRVCASDAAELVLHGMVILIMISYCPCAVRIGAVPVRRRIDVVPGDVALISRMVEKVSQRTA